MPGWDGEAVQNNLLLPGQVQAEFEAAVGEWSWNGELSIVNSKTGHSLLVGSDCILRFDIAVCG